MWSAVWKFCTELGRSAMSISTLIYSGKNNKVCRLIYSTTFIHLPVSAASSPTVHLSFLLPHSLCHLHCSPDSKTHTINSTLPLLGSLIDFWEKKKVGERAKSSVYVLQCVSIWCLKNATDCWSLMMSESGGGDSPPVLKSVLLCFQEFEVLACRTMASTVVLDGGGAWTD